MLRSLVASAVVLLATVTQTAARAGAPPKPQANSPIATPAWTADDHYRYAVRCLHNGRTYERAAQHLREAIRLNPDSPDYWLALACACTARHLSLSYSVVANDQLKNQREAAVSERMAWEAGARAAEAEGKPFDQPPPAAGPPEGWIVPAKDDGKNPPTAPEILLPHLAALHKEAVDAFAHAQKSAQGSTVSPETRAAVEQTRAWGQILLTLGALMEAQIRQNHGRPEDKDSEALDALETVSFSDLRLALRFAERATEITPDDPIAWEGLGYIRELLANIPSELLAAKPTSPPTPDDLETRAPEKPTEETAWAAYDRALALRKHNAPLWFKKAWHERKNAGEDTEKARAAARPFLTAAAKDDPANALYRYESAALDFEDLPFLAYQGILARRANSPERESTPDQQKEEQQTIDSSRSAASRQKGREALRGLEWGNAAPVLTLRAYAPPVPHLLAATWAECAMIANQLNAPPPTHLQELAFTVCGYAHSAAEEGNFADATRAARAVTTMGQKMMGDWPIRNRGRNTGEQDMASAGRSVIVAGYKALEYVLDQAGDQEGSERVKAERSAFQKKAQDWQMAVTAAQEKDRWSDPFLP